MRRFRTRARRDERGASLVLAIVFTLVAGTIGASLIPAVTQGIHNLSTLDKLRDRQYAADGVVEQSIARVRGLAVPGVTACNTADPGPQSLNGVSIRVDCVNAPAVAPDANGNPVTQNDVIFTACANTGLACSDLNNNVIVRSQVNYQGTTPFQVTVLSWSVNG